MGEPTPLDYLNLYLERVDAVNVYWNILVTVCLGILGLLATGLLFSKHNSSKLMFSIGLVIFFGGNFYAVCKANMQNMAIRNLLQDTHKPIADAFGYSDPMLLGAFYVAIAVAMLLAIWLIDWVQPTRSGG